LADRAVRTSVETVYCREGRIDLLFTDAGFHIAARLEDTSLEDFERVLAVNLKGLFCTLKYALRSCAARATATSSRWARTSASSANPAAPSTA